jgi:hypothetical protein
LSSFARSDAQREERLMQIMEALKPRRSSRTQGPRPLDFDGNPMGVVRQTYRRASGAQIEALYEQDGAGATSISQLTEFRQNMVNAVQSARQPPIHRCVTQ